MTVEKSVTIVYSWDSEEHRDWVKKLAEELERNGVQVTYDQNSLALGDDINQFMEVAVDTASIILAVCTEQYKQKIDGREGGSGYEGRMMAQVIKNHSAKIIPITKDGYKDTKIPRSLQGLTTIDLGMDIKKEKFAHLLQSIYGFKIVKETKKVDPRKTIADALEVKLEEVKKSLENGSDVNTTDEEGYSALQAAAENGYLDVVEYLVTQGVDVSYKGEYTALELAEMAGNQEIVSYLKSLKGIA